MRGITVTLQGRYGTALAHRVPARIPIREVEGRSSFTLPELRDYELIELTELAPASVRK